MSDRSLNITAKLEAIRVKVDGMQHAANVDFVLTMGIIVFLMQGGFALLEAGAVR